MKHCIDYAKQYANRKRRLKARLRFPIRCYYCCALIDNFEAHTFDHKLPIILGGTNDPDNLVDCCRFCNYHKANLTEEKFKILLWKIKDELLSRPDISTNDNYDPIAS